MQVVCHEITFCSSAENKTYFLLSARTKDLATLPSQYTGVASTFRKQYLDGLSSVSVLLIASLYYYLCDAVWNLYRIKIPGKRLLGLVIV
jgi:hypothetical protein